MIEIAIPYWAVGQTKSQTQPLKGAKMPIPIMSSEFSYEFQLDLIEMRNKREKKIYSILQRWITTLRDHATTLTYLASFTKEKMPNVLLTSLITSLD